MEPNAIVKVTLIVYNYDIERTAEKSVVLIYEKIKLMNAMPCLPITNR